MRQTPSFSRRDFLKLSGLGLGAFALPQQLTRGIWRPWENEFPTAARLGRAVEDFGRPVNVRAAPNSDAALVGEITGDDIVEWLREVVGYTPYRNQRWVETPQGYIWSPLLQPVRNLPNPPLSSLSVGDSPGLWMEVTVPYVNAQLINSPPRGFRVSFLIENRLPVRFYYGQVLWVDDIRTNDDGVVEYRVGELHGHRGDVFWAAAEAFKPIYPEDVTPISPDVENKRIDINLARQTLSCFEDEREVFFCRVSTGDYGEGRATPVGEYLQVFMKYLSTHMEGGSTGAGYDLGGIGWATFIATGGIAIHSTYWHNNFGERTSAGCVNVTQEDAKHIYRWTSPEVPYYPGKTELAGTRVRVIEG